MKRKKVEDVTHVEIWFRDGTWKSYSDVKGDSFDGEDDLNLMMFEYEEKGTICFACINTQSINVIEMR